MPRNAHPNLLVHVGCGKLAGGAVIPFLHLQFPKSRMLILQRASERWAHLEDGEVVVFRNTAGFHGVYPVLKVNSPSELKPKLAAFLKDTATRSALLIVPRISYARNLIESGSRQVTVSCCLGDGQRDLVSVLRPVPKAIKQILVFENSMDDAWSALGAHHVVVDRICPPTDFQDSGRKVFKENGTRDARTAVFEYDCEEKFCSFTWPEALDGLLSTRYTEASPRVKELGFGHALFLSGSANIGLEQKKKRAMVNATHAIMTILVCRVLAERKMATKNQYLAPLYAYMAREKPEWGRALDTYIRLRALTLVLHPQGMALKQKEACQAAFDRLYQMGVDAKERFVTTADLIERVFTGKRLVKDIAKYTEHIVKPFREYRKVEEDSEKYFTYRRPDRVEIAHLKDFLDSSFLMTMAWLSENE